MKKILSALLLIFFGLVGILFAEDKFPFVAEATVDNLNIRAGYNINFEVIHKLKQRDKLIVLDKEFDWYKVELPSEASCFINEKYIVKKSDSEAQVSAKGVNVRARPDIKSNVLCQLGKEDSVNIVKRSNKDWYQIQPPKNCYGWVYDKFIQYYSTIEEYKKERQAQLVKIENGSTKPETAKVISEGEKNIQELGQDRFAFQQVGTIKRVTAFFNKPASYRLIQNDKIICYLKDDKTKLNSFVNLRVKVLGNIQNEAGYKYPVVIAEKILIIE